MSKNSACKRDNDLVTPEEMREIIRRAGFTQAEFAKILDLCPQTVRKKLSGKVKISRCEQLLLILLRDRRSISLFLRELL